MRQELRTVNWNSIAEKNSMRPCGEFVDYRRLPMGCTECGLRKQRAHRVEVAGSVQLS